MPVRSKCLAAPQSIPSAVTTIHTVAADETTLVKWLALVNSGTTDRNVSFWVNSGSGDIRIGLVPVLQQSETQLEVWWVLQPNWVLRWSSSSGVVGSVHGSELEGVAD